MTLPLVSAIVSAMPIAAVDLGLVTTDETLPDFYVDALGATRLEPRSFPVGTLHRLSVGPITLKIMIPAEAPAPAQPSEVFWDTAGYRYVTLWVDDLDGLVGAWEGAGGTVKMAPFELRPGVRTAVLADPDGNAIEAMQQG